MKFNLVQFTSKESMPFLLLVILSGLLLGGCGTNKSTKLEDQRMQFEKQMEAQRIQIDKQASLKGDTAEAKIIKENEDKINKEKYIKEVFERNAEKIKSLAGC